ncbi:gas vesicle protein GvpG [Nonomuraea sp. NPDC049480]|uniref:gas vesicle protein GvpG n=1 Tax=Nonomuraea sp. NPDC049480 TaxID=3364353 RepID=UPI0037993D78
MGLLGSLATLPLAPVRGVIRLAELIQEQVERETRNPAAIRRALEELDAAREAGELTEEEHDQAVRRVLQRLTGR